MKNRNQILAFIISLSTLYIAEASAITYQYDSTNRIKQANYDKGTVVSYEYDLEGNLAKVNITENLSGNDTDIDSNSDSNDIIDNDTNETEPTKKESGGSFDFGLFPLLLLSLLFRRFKYK